LRLIVGNSHRAITVQGLLGARLEIGRHFVRRQLHGQLNGVAVLHFGRPQLAQHGGQRRLAEQLRFLIGKWIEFRSDKEMRYVVQFEGDILRGQLTHGWIPSSLDK
jgi:hypothetical protein